MGIGAESSFLRRALFRFFSRRYFRRTCSTRDGSFEVYVSAGSSLKVLDVRKPLVDPIHERFIKDWIKPDAIVWDIGGNLGLFALPAALKAAAGHVYVFEPDVDLAANLCRTLRLRGNRNLNVSVVCLAVSNSVDVTNFEISKFSRAMNKLQEVGRWNAKKVIAEELRLVPTMSIDALANALKPPTVLKIDVEGAEIDVLRGGETTISRSRPIILIEAQRRLHAPISAFFEKHRYVMLDGAAEHQSPLAHPVWDTVAIPGEAFPA
jgi:FkbM family methyltransferase